MIVLGNALSLSLLVSRGKSARLLPEAKRDSSEFRVVRQSNSYRAARETLVFHACRRHARLPLFLHPSPLDEISISFRGN